MCISWCHIIFWGDKTITKLGNNVIKHHGNVNITYAIIATFIRYEHTMRKHVLLGVGYNELRQKMKIKCISTEEIGLLPWVVCASGIVFESWVIFNDEWRWRIINVSTWWNWWNSLMTHSEVEWWTTETSFQYNVSLINSVHRWMSDCRMNIASKLSPFLLLWWTHWGKSSCGQQGCDSRCDVKLMNSLRRSFCYQMNIFIKSDFWYDVRGMSGVRRRVFCSRWSIFIKTVWLLTKQDVMISARGGATVLKVGGTILRAERAKKFFLTPPLFGQWGGTKYCLDS